MYLPVSFVSYLASAPGAHQMSRKRSSQRTGCAFKVGLQTRANAGAHATLRTDHDLDHLLDYLDEYHLDHLDNLDYLDHLQ